MTPPTPHYRPEIDGLRGIAILAVVANHIDSRILPGGFVGVDVFFVISGYLITSILLREASQGAVSFTRFYARRVRRLLPAAAVMSAIVTLLAGAIFLPRDLKDLGASLVAAFAHVVPCCRRAVLSGFSMARRCDCKAPTADSGGGVRSLVFPLFWLERLAVRSRRPVRVLLTAESVI
ncbi:MAG: acyltransferase [Pirellulales bacterium]